MSTYPLATSNSNRLQLLGGHRAARAAKSEVVEGNCLLAGWLDGQLASWQRQQLMFHPLFRTFAPGPGPKAHVDSSASPHPGHLGYPWMARPSRNPRLTDPGISCTALRTCSHFAAHVTTKVEFIEYLPLAIWFLIRPGMSYSMCGIYTYPHTITIQNCALSTCTYANLKPK